jgi:membrane associated rhomboid family serine protease
VAFLLRRVRVQPTQTPRRRFIVAFTLAMGVNVVFAVVYGFLGLDLLNRLLRAVLLGDRATAIIGLFTLVSCSTTTITTLCAAAGGVIGAALEGWKGLRSMALFGAIFGLIMGLVLGVLLATAFAWSRLLPW